MAKAILSNCSFIGNRIGIRTRGNVQLEADNTIFQDNGIGLDMKEDFPQEVLDLFTNGVNRKKLIEVVQESLRTESLEPLPLAKKLKKSGLSRWIANGANTVTVATAIVEIIKNYFS